MVLVLVFDGNSSAQVILQPIHHKKQCTMISFNYDIRKTFVYQVGSKLPYLVGSIPVKNFKVQNCSFYATTV